MQLAQCAHRLVRQLNAARSTQQPRNERPPQAAERRTGPRRWAPVGALGSRRVDTKRELSTHEASCCCCCTACAQRLGCRAAARSRAAGRGVFRWTWRPRQHVSAQTGCESARAARPCAKARCLRQARTGVACVGIESRPALARARLRRLTAQVAQFTRSRRRYSFFGDRPRCVRTGLYGLRRHGTGERVDWRG